MSLTSVQLARRSWSPPPDSSGAILTWCVPRDLFARPSLQAEVESRHPRRPGLSLLIGLRVGKRFVPSPIGFISGTRWSRNEDDVLEVRVAGRWWRAEELTLLDNWPRPRNARGTRWARAWKIEDGLRRIQNLVHNGGIDIEYERDLDATPSLPNPSEICPSNAGRLTQ